MVAYLPRTDWFGTGPPDMNNGSPRPLLGQPVPGLTVHYRGSPINDSATASPVSYMQAAEQRADWAGKSFEYNYIILPGRAGGLVCEYAGLYRAAHSAGENHWIGVQFALGVNNHPSYRNYDPGKPTVWQPVDDDMINAYRWLRDVHLAGVLSANFDQLQHRQMPGAATACPGQAIIDRWADLLTAYTEPSEPDMITVNPSHWFTTDITHGTPLVIDAPFGANVIVANLTVKAAKPGYVVAWDGEGDLPTGASVQIVPNVWANNLARIQAGPGGTMRFDYVGEGYATVNVGIQALG